MDRAIQIAVRQLRESAAECGYPLDHLTDEEIVEGVGAVSIQLSQEGQAINLMRAGVQKVGKTFIDLQRVGFIVANP
jgi:hypothetical protein